MSTTSHHHPRTYAALQALLLLAALSSCRAVGGPRWRAIATEDGRDVTVDSMAADLARFDVVFLGEEHDNDVGHALQLELTRALGERRGALAVSLEMLERDAQDQLELYFAGAIDEERFLATSRPWKNYAEHYRPAVELARERGWSVIAANCYRPLAARVAREGLGSVAGDPWAARWVDAGPGEYRDLFTAAMGDHAADLGSRLDLFFAAQCLKDDTMAESIARFLDGAGDDPPLVVHWNGKFHSDYGLGTVERLLARRPDLTVAVVTMISTDEVGRELTTVEGRAARYVWLVPEQPSAED